EAAYGVTPPSLPDAVPLGPPKDCQQAIGSAATRLASTWASTLLKCEGANASGKNDPPLDCSLASKITKAQESADGKIDACTSYTGIEGCAQTAVSNAALSQCVEDAIGDVVPAYPELAYP